MQVNPPPPGNGGVFGSAGIAASSVSATSSASAPASGRFDLSSARRQLFDVLKAFDEVQRLMDGGSSILRGLPSARSDPALDLNLIPTAARLRSVDEVNATPTSFSPFVPAWGNASSAFMTIGGAYDGSDGSGTLSFEVRSGGVHGLDRLRVRVRGPDNNILQTVTIREDHANDRQYDLRNGLYFTLGPGSLERFDTTAIQVSSSIGSAVDPDKPFDGTGNDDPNFQFGLPGIVAGSFEINGVTIGVAADDSLNDVLDTINQSAAGVTAVFNPLTERVDLLNNTPGSTGAIDIEAGDSNFVAATKLLGAVLEPGADADPARPLESVAQFAGVLSGSILVNGDEIAFDAASDSLNDIIERINTSEAGAVASFDPGTQRVVIAAHSDRDELVIDGNGTGLFGALNIPEGRVDARARGSGYDQPRAQRIVNAMSDAMEALNDFFRQTRRGRRASSELTALRNQVKSAFSGALGGTGSRVDTGLGLEFNLNAVGTEYTRFVTVDPARLSQRLQTSGTTANQYLNGSGDEAGLINATATAIQGAFQSLNGTLGTRGTLFDAYA